MVNSYELYYHEKQQHKIQLFQQELIDGIVKLMHDGKEKLMERDYKELVVMVKDFVDEEFEQINSMEEE